MVKNVIVLPLTMNEPRIPQEFKSPPNDKASLFFPFSEDTLTVHTYHPPREYVPRGLEMACHHPEARVGGGNMTCTCVMPPNLIKCF